MIRRAGGIIRTMPSALATRGPRRAAVQRINEMKSAGPALRVMIAVIFAAFRPWVGLKYQNLRWRNWPVSCLTFIGGKKVRLQQC